MKLRARACVIFISCVCQSPPTESCTQHQFISVDIVVVRRSCHLHVFVPVRRQACDGDNRCSDNWFVSQMSAIENRQHQIHPTKLHTFLRVYVCLCETSGNPTYDVRPALSAHTHSRRIDCTCVYACLCVCASAA